MKVNLHSTKNKQETKLRKYVLSINDKEYCAEVKDISTESATIIVNDKEYNIDLKDIGRQSVPVINTAPQTPASKPAVRSETKKSVQIPGTGNGVTAPLPGLIIDILVSENASVKSGQTIAIMEAMKMENQIKAPHDGIVKKIYFSKGESISEGDVILEIERSVMTSL